MNLSMRSSWDFFTMFPSVGPGSEDAEALATGSAERAPRSSRSLMASMIFFVSSGPMRPTDLLMESKVALRRLCSLLEPDRVLRAADGLVVVQDALDDARVAQPYVAGNGQVQQLVADVVEMADPWGVLDSVIAILVSSSPSVTSSIALPYPR